LAPGEALRLAREEVSRRLPLFESHHRGTSWPRDVLGELEAAAESAQESPPIAPPPPEATGPGGNNFVNAVEALIHAAQAATDTPRSEAFAAEAIAEAIMSEMVERWGSSYPGSWSAWYEAATSGEAPPQPDALVAMMNDPESAAIELRGWLALHASLRRQLSPDS
jgi:hypothetical protein